jgi:steroid delta-isomerase-like uncharacterized protein
LAAKTLSRTPAASLSLGEERGLLLRGAQRKKNPDQEGKTLTTTEESAARSATAALIRRYYDHFNRGETSAMEDMLTDDVIHDVNQGERRVGKDKFRAFNARMTHNYQERLENITVLVSKDGTRAAAEFNVHGKYLNSEEGLPAAKGQTYVLPAGTFFAIRDGKIARVTTYYNLTDWIAQVA